MLPTFNDPSLLQRALTHRSFRNEFPAQALEDNERLEFLGDAVLDFVAGALLYNRYPEMQEGRLTSLRAAIVRTETLAQLATQCGVQAVLRLGRGEEDSGGRARAATLCGAFEAMIGALYLDQGLEAVRAYVEPIFEPLAQSVVAEALDRDPKSQLQALVQSRYNATPYYRTVATSGPDHAKEFTVEVYLHDTMLARGGGHSKQAAAMEAARHALAALLDEPPAPLSA